MDSQALEGSETSKDWVSETEHLRIWGSEWSQKQWNFQTLRKPTFPETPSHLDSDPISLLSFPLPHLGLLSSLFLLGLHLLLWEKMMSEGPWEDSGSPKPGRSVSWDTTGICVSQLPWPLPTHPWGRAPESLLPHPSPDDQSPFCHPSESSLLDTHLGYSSSLRTRPSDCFLARFLQSGLVL